MYFNCVLWVLCLRIVAVYCGYSDYALSFLLCIVGTMTMFSSCVLCVQ